MSGALFANSEAILKFQNSKPNSFTFLMNARSLIHRTSPNDFIECTFRALKSFRMIVWHDSIFALASVNFTPACLQTHERVRTSDRRFDHPPSLWVTSQAKPKVCPLALVFRSYTFLTEVLN